MKALFTYLVYGSWWVSLCAASLGLLSWYELTDKWWNAPLFLFILGSTLVIYNLNMLSGLEDLRNRGTHSERHHWCMDNEQLMKATMVIGILMAATSVWFLNMHVWLFMIPLTIVALIYTVPILRRQAQRIRLREIGLWKIFIIAVVWAGMTVILPAVNLEGLEQITDPYSWQLGIERGIFILAITIPFDIRDLINDAKKGVRTIPSTIGWKRSVWLSETLMVFFIAMIAYRLGMNGPLFYGYLVSSLITMAGLSFATPERNDMYCSFWIEGTMLLQFLLVFAFV